MREQHGMPGVLPGAVTDLRTGDADVRVQRGSGAHRGAQHGLRGVMRGLAAAVALVVAGCGITGESYRDPEVSIASQADFDVEKYEGLWYEIARFPVSFQEGCMAVTARYELQPTGEISVTNTCREGALDGPLKSISGQATVTGPGQLSVSFTRVPFISAPYWVLWVDEDYRTAVVGVPSGRAGWILNRDPQIPRDRLRAALEVLDFNGYDVTRIEPTRQWPQ